MFRKVSTMCGQRVVVKHKLIDQVDQQFELKEL